jgi:uncharacterized phage-like protein YoqJ
MIISFTGHRPQRLGLDYSDKSNLILKNFVIDNLPSLGLKIDKILSGGATGFDQAVAEAAIDLSIPYVIALPFKDMDAKWPKDGRDRFKKLLDKATEVLYICEGGYANWKFFIRDEYLVKNCNTLIALYDGKEGSGTSLTVKSANTLKIPVINLWEKWINVKSNIKS